MPVEEHIQYLPESSAVDLRSVVWPALAVVLLLATAVGGLYAVYEVSLPVKTVQPPQTFAAPRVTTHANEVAELRRLAAEQVQRLSTWRWADDQHALVEIPIDRAMKLLTQKGKDAWSPLIPAQPALPSPAAGAERAITPDSPLQGTAANSLPTDSEKPSAHQVQP